jgi:hypothetical protein
MAPVAKSTIKLGQNKRISAIMAPARTCRLGSPGAGLVRWHSLTWPPNTVAQLLKNVITIVAISKSFAIFIFVSG